LVAMSSVSLVICDSKLWFFADGRGAQLIVFIAAHCDTLETMWEN